MSIFFSNHKKFAFNPRVNTRDKNNFVAYFLSSINDKIIHNFGSVLESGISKKFVFEKNEFKV